MITIDTLKDLTHYLNNRLNQPEQLFIQSQGLAKNKHLIYPVLESIENKNSQIKLNKSQEEFKDYLLKQEISFIKSLRLSLLTSYFTPKELVQDIVRPLSEYYNQKQFKPNILEPSSGTGNFIDALLENFEASNIVGVEKDIMTSQILEENFKDYQNFKPINIGFENYPVENKHDLIISNIPFGNFGIFDSQLPKQSYGLYKNEVHNYFFTKAEALLNKGGLIAFITTSSFSDNFSSSNIREHLLQRLNLITAIRLDNSLFNGSNTSVVTDLILLQKPYEEKQRLTAQEQSFLKYSDITINDNKYSINNYFFENQNNVLGEFVETRQHFGNLGISVAPSERKPIRNVNEILKIDIERYAEKELKHTPLKRETEVSTIIQQEELYKLYPHIKPGNYVEVKGKLYITDVHPEKSKELNLTEVKLKDNEKLIVKAMIPIRESYKSMMLYQRANQLEGFLKEQAKLHEYYDVFDFYYGAINLPNNSNVLKKDRDFDLIISLEKQDPKNKLQYSKSDIFFTKSFETETKTEITNLEDAIIYSFNEVGKIDAELISKTIGVNEETWALEAIEKQLLFINPVFDQERNVQKVELVLKNTFESGYIESKMNFFKTNANDNHHLSKYKGAINRKLLDQYRLILLDKLPLKLNINEINPVIGEPWIDIKVYEDFCKEHFKDTKFSISYLPKIDLYNLKSGYSSFANDLYSVNINQKYIAYKNIMKYALYHNVPSFKKTIFKNGVEVKVLDKELITAINLKVELLNDNFKKWLINKSDLSKSLESFYNYHHNSYVKEIFDATSFDFGIKTLTPYDHQKNGAWHLINNNGGILDLKVGFGKTATMSMAISKRLDFKITSKELLVGLNANYIDLYNEFLKFYPNKKVLLVTPDDLKKENKSKTFYNIANNNWDLIVTAHSCLIKFPEDIESKLHIYNDQLEEAKEIHRMGKDEIGGSNIRDLDKKIENLKASIERLNSILESKKNNDFISFKDLKIDHITIDESQYFKNLAFSTQHSRVAGLGNQTDVQKTANLLSYIRAIQNKYNDDKGVTFSTGTTISNSLSELYTLFKYITPRELEKSNTQSFDQWARFYCRKTQKFEETVSGEIKLKERFRYYVKVPELAKQYSRITSFANDSTFKMEKPELKHHLISIEPYKEQNNYFEKIKEFGRTKNGNLLIGYNNSQNISKASGLICVNEGRKASLDMRLISESFGDHPGNKINVMIDHAMKIYSKYDDEKGTQLIFCDQGTPTSKGFNLYAAIKDNLITKGVPKNEIAFIHSYKKPAVLFEKVNTGEIRFVIGSTQKMGVGVNVQQKLVAMHHLDFPWRPTDVEQRNGRGDRQGNVLLPKYDNIMDGFYYAKKNSIDAYVFNLLQIKQNFISQIKNASITTRTLDEGMISEDGSMAYEDFVAICSNNSLYIDKLKVEKELKTHLGNYSAYSMGIRQNTLKAKIINDDILKKESQIEKLNDDFTLSKKLIKEPFELKVHDTVFKTPEDLGIYLKKLLSQCISKQSVSSYVTLEHSFKLKFEFKNAELPLDHNNYKVIISTPNNLKIGYNNNVLVKENATAGHYIYNTLERFPDIIKTQRNHLSELKEQHKHLTAIISEPFKDLDKIKSLEAELKKIDQQIENDKAKDKPNDKGPSL